MYKCIDCGIKVSTKNTKRCHSCATKYTHKTGKLNLKGKRNGMYGKKGDKSPAYIDGRTKIKYYCIKCKSKITYGNKTKLCKSCSMKKLFKNPTKHPNYKDGRTIIKHYCKCGKEIKNYYNKYCKSCGSKLSWKKGDRQRRTYIGKNNPNFDNHKLKGNKNPMFGKNRKNEIVKHHLDLNKKNNKQKNLLKLTQSKHSKLHQRAYEYLVRTKQIRNYIKWFDKKYQLK
jgi:hypothetical protein